MAGFHFGRRSRSVSKAASPAPGSPNHSADASASNTPRESPGLAPVRSGLFSHGLFHVTSSTSIQTRPSTPLVAPAEHTPKALPVLDVNFRLESGPVVMYGTPEDSTGSLLSGIMDLKVARSKPVMLRGATMQIVQQVEFYGGASRGRQQILAETKKTEIIAKWHVLSHPQEFGEATHGYPFSHLMPGSLPPTCRTSLFSIRYYLEATIDPSPEEAELRPYIKHLDLKVGRSVTHIVDKTSVRLFPPTAVNISMDLPTAVFPRSSIRAELRIEGLMGENVGSDRIKRWRAKRISWQFEEITKISFPPAPEGREDLIAPEPIKQRITLAAGQLKSGWKSDFSHQGLVQLVTSNLAPGALDHAEKDIRDPVLGISIEHNLSFEIVIAEEIAPVSGSGPKAMTGNARVLRMKFKICVADRPGLSISWDDEVPPVYADIPMSPPTYETVTILPSLEELQNVAFSPAFSPAIHPAPSPTIRHIDSLLSDRNRIRQRQFSARELTSMIDVDEEVPTDPENEHSSEVSDNSDEED